MNDTARQRALAHQARKADTLEAVMADTLATIINTRRSTRRFTREPVAPEHLKALHDAADHAPSACDRRGVGLVDITTRDELAILGGLLVGGVGWIHRAPLVILLMADPTAYSGTTEITDLAMPKLDAGHIGQNLQLTATALGLGACFVNPNIRKRNRNHFAVIFGKGILCGAVAVGHPWAE